MTFKQKLSNVIAKNNSLVCVGLDPDIEKIPQHIREDSSPLFTFNKAIIDATSDMVCAYKPNIAFYEAEGIEGLKQLKRTIEYLKEQYPDIPVVLDAKRADIPNTAERYAKAVFEYWDADAITVYPNLGLDSVAPFLVYENKLTIMLIKTSNPDSKTFQDIDVNQEPYYLVMAKKIKEWSFDNMGIFVGATYPKELREIRSLFPDRVFLSAGIGAQTAEIKEAVQAGINAKGGGIMFNAGRSILYASGNSDFAEKARGEAGELRDKINRYRK